MRRTGCFDSAVVGRAGGLMPGPTTKTGSTSNWSTIELACRGAHRDQRNIDWGATLDAAAMFDVADRVVVPRTRAISVSQWLIDQASHSDVAALEGGSPNELVGPAPRDPRGPIPHRKHGRAIRDLALDATNAP